MNALGILYVIFLHVLSFSQADSASAYKASAYKEGITLARYYHKNFLRYDCRYYTYRQNQSQSFSFIQNGIVNVRKRGSFLQVELNCCRVSVDNKILLSSGVYLGSMLFIRRADFVSIGMRLDARPLYKKNIK
ncbi:MAG: hypothetical protein QXN68_06255 [Thermoplasmata archaeon]